jgi:hypothetical protein
MTGCRPTMKAAVVNINQGARCGLPGILAEDFGAGKWFLTP